MAAGNLALGPVFTYDELFGAMEKFRQRTLRTLRTLRIVELVDLGAHDGICAVWLSTETEDLILHAPSDSDLHRQQFILHEFAHMLLGHGQEDECPIDDVLLPDIPARTRGRLLTRQYLDSESEIAAEYLADMLAGGIRRSTFTETRYSEVFG